MLIPDDATPLSDKVEELDIPVEFAPTFAHPIRVRSRPVPTGTRIARHTHSWAQLACTSRGVLRIAASGSTWMVPPSRAIWVPPRVTHELVIVDDAYLRTLYIDESVIPAGLDACRVVEVSPLLREVVVALDDTPLSRERERLLGTLALDEITRSQPLPLAVPMPTDKRLLALCEAVLASPSSAASLEHWAEEAGASTRTIARLFQRELGISFSQWRQQAVLAHAIPLLSQGKPLAQVALALGYQSQSAFSAMFRRAFGESPRAFFVRHVDHHDQHYPGDQGDQGDQGDRLDEDDPQPAGQRDADA